VSRWRHQRLLVPRIAAGLASPLEPYQGSPLVKPPLELLKGLMKKSFARSSEAVFEGYRMSKRVDRKVQNKVKSLESAPAVHFPSAPVSLVKEWHQMMAIPKIRKVSMI
jgi:hypothetical protein